jgi:UDP-N-acetylmuramoyl-L-alanyl-D-glutamate--2,6-diaminopimelate ligase
MISTVNAVIGDETVDTGFHVTTPEAPDIQHFLSRMVAKGITHVILETTSHALEQKRVNECEFDLGVITNVTHEHLDYHGSFEAYLRAKSLLFQSLSTTAEKSMNPTRGAVLNFDDPSFDYLSQVTKVNMIHYGLSIGSNFRPENIVQDGDGLSFSVASRLPERPDYHIPVRSKLFGEYNILNILAACALTIGLMDLEIDFVRLGIEKLKGIPGRMEKIDLGQEFLCFVDFAHTPNALENVLRNSRKILEQDQIHQGRIIAVFGSAGLRDKQKRNMMAKISGRLADISILTAEDPRTESLEAILLEMEEGIKAGGRQGGTEYHIIPDRGEAIQLAIDIAEAGDMVIICGKGHEQSMCFGNTEYLWDDRTAALSAISKRLGIIGPAMPYLPTSRK